MAEEIKFEIPEAEVDEMFSEEEKQESQTPDTTGMSKQEVELAKKHGLIKEDKSGEKPEVKKESVKSGIKTEEKETEESEGEKIVEDFLSGKELTPEQEDKVSQHLNKNARGLYQRMKKEISKRQLATARAQHVEIKLNAAERKIKELSSKSTKEFDADEDLFGESNTEIKDTSVDTTPKMTEEEWVEAQQSRNLIMNDVEINMRDNYEDYDETVKLAKEYLDKEKPERLIKRMQEAFKSFDGSNFKINPAETAYDIGLIAIAKGYKPNSNQGKENPEGKEVTTEKVERIINNTKKRVSSAALGDMGSKRIVSENDMTVEDAAKLSPSNFAKLSQSTRERLLMESCKT